MTTHTVEGFLSILLILSVENTFLCNTGKCRGHKVSWWKEGGRRLMELAEDICNRAFKCQLSGDLASQWCPALVLIHPLRDATNRSKDSHGRTELATAVQMFAHTLFPFCLYENKVEISTLSFMQHGTLVQVLLQQVGQKTQCTYCLFCCFYKCILYRLSTIFPITVSPS